MGYTNMYVCMCMYSRVMILMYVNEYLWFIIFRVRLQSSAFSLFVDSARRTWIIFPPKTLVAHMCILILEMFPIKHQKSKMPDMKTSFEASKAQVSLICIIFDYLCWDFWENMYGTKLDPINLVSFPFFCFCSNKHPSYIFEPHVYTTIPCMNAYMP